MPVSISLSRLDNPPIALCTFLVQTMSRPQSSKDKTPAPVTSKSRMAVSLSPCIMHASAGQRDHLEQHSVNLSIRNPRPAERTSLLSLNWQLYCCSWSLMPRKRCTRLSNGSQPVTRSCFIFANLSHSKKTGSVFIYCEQLDLLYYALIYQIAECSFLTEFTVVELFWLLALQHNLTVFSLSVRATFLGSRVLSSRPVSLLLSMHKYCCFYGNRNVPFGFVQRFRMFFGDDEVVQPEVHIAQHEGIIHLENRAGLGGLLRWQCCISS